MTTSRLLATLALALSVSLVSGSLFAATPAPAPSTTTAPAKTGTVSGKVVDKDGKPAKDVQVRFMATPAGGAAPGGRNAGGRNGGRGGMAAAVTTDDKGVFTLKDVPVGATTIIATLAPAGGARQRGQATADVKENAETKLTEEIKLADAPARGGAAGGGRGNRGAAGGAPATPAPGN